jgi:hypothetical protein
MKTRVLRATGPGLRRASDTGVGDQCHSPIESSATPAVLSPGIPVRLRFYRAYDLRPLISWRTNESSTYLSATTALRLPAYLVCKSHSR